MFAFYDYSAANTKISRSLIPHLQGIGEYCGINLSPPALLKIPISTGKSHHSNVHLDHTQNMLVQ